MALASITVTASAFLTAGTTSANVLIPTTGTPTTLLVTNTSDQMAYVALGIGAGTTATLNASIAIPRQSTSVPIAISTNTYIAGIVAIGTAGLSITVGT